MVSQTRIRNKKPTVSTKPAGVGIGAHISHLLALVLAATALGGTYLMWEQSRNNQQQQIKLEKSLSTLLSSLDTTLDHQSDKLGELAAHKHPDILDRLKYTQAATMSAVEAALAAIFGKENYWVAKATYSNTNESATFSASAIIDDDCLVCHVDSMAGLFGATAGKTFVWAGGGGEGSIYSHYDQDRHASIIQHKEQWDQATVATDLGYFFSDIV